MGLQFTPKREDELQKPSRKLLEKGYYDFEVLEAEDKVSQKGDPYINLKVGVFDSNGNQRWIFDSLMGIESMLYKLRHFCEETNLMQKYESGQLAACDCVGRAGICYVTQRKEKVGKYAGELVNKISDYGEEEEDESGPTPKQSAPSESKSEDDDVLF